MPAPGVARSQSPQLPERAAAPRPNSSPQSVASRSCGVVPRLLIAPCVPVISAMAAGIVLDRYLEPWGTQKWVGVALAFAAIAVFLARRALISVALVLAAVAALGGAWHHARYSDLAPDDLARRLTETARPVWVRGVVRDTLGVRASEGFGYGDQTTALSQPGSSST